MGVPVSVEPFTEPESDRGVSPAWIDRLLAAPFVKPVIGAALFVVLWADAAREGLWDLPSPFEAGSFGTIAPFGGYVVALAAGVSLGALVRRHQRVTPADALPRLPVFLRFDHRRVVVIGGGAVAASKIPALLAAGADVTVIAPSISGDIDRSRVRTLERAFTASDLDGAWFATAAATPDVNREVREAAEDRGIFVNAVDDPGNATAYLGGTIARGGVTVAISTHGEAPALAGLLREAFDELVPADIGTWAKRAGELRRRQRAEGVPMAARRPQLLDALNRLYDGRERTAATQPSFATAATFAQAPADRSEGR
jgi:siroheme synthase-like protein